MLTNAYCHQAIHLFVQGIKRRRWLHQTLRIMQLTAVFLLALSLALHAKSDAQTITYSGKSVPLIKIFNQIKQQTGYFVVYNEAQLSKAKKVTVDAKDIPLQDFLNEVFKNAAFEYTIEGRTIAVKKKAATSPPAPVIAVAEVVPAAEPVVAPPVSGVVRGSDGSPLADISIVVKGTTRGTTTNATGNFSVEAAAGDTLVVSGIGFKAREIRVSNTSVLSITLETESAELDKVVVVAFGEQSKMKVTGAISTVQSKDLKAVQQVDLVSGLAGRLPGVRIKQNSNEPGSYSSSFDIRGLGDPLIVVDGMVMENRDFARMNPATIASISVVKDASAAVYGVKAANGVVLVKTKKGAAGKPTVSYNGNYGLLGFTKTPEPLSPYEFAVYSTEIEINQGKSPNETTFRPEDIEKLRTGEEKGTNWYDLVTRKYSSQQIHNVSVSGGTDKIQYFTSFGYMGEEGMWKSGDLNYKKFNINSNITSKISDNLEMQLTLNAVLDNKNEPGAPAFIPGSIGGIYFSLFMQNPTVPVYANNTAPYYSDTYDGQHPIAITTADIGGYRKTKTRTFQGTYSLDYKIPFVKGLIATARVGFYNLEGFQKTWKPTYLMYRYEALTTSYVNSATKNDPANLTGDYVSLQRLNLNGQLSYKKSLGLNNINATLIYEERMEKNDNFWGTSEFDSNVDQFFAGTRNPQVNAANIYENRSKNVIGRVNYDYDKRYLLEAGFNYGGSSFFPKATRWGFFPYVSAGWNIAEESFFHNVLPDLTSFKLRGSWGQLGDDGTAAFQFLQGYTYPSGSYVFDGKLTPGLGFRGLPNPNITWITATSKNIGLEADYKNGLIGIEIDFFQRDRSGLLATRALTLPGTVGVNLPQENLNSDRSQGFEVVLRHANKIGKLDYFLSANISYTNTRATHIERADDANKYLAWRNNTVDRNNNIAWGYKVEGNFQSFEEILSSPLQGDPSQGNRYLFPGDLKYEDINNDGIINNLDVVPIGKGVIPQTSFALNGGVSYKSFDLSFLLQGAAGFNYIDDFWYDRGLLWLGRNGLHKFYDRWHRADLFDPNSEWIPGRFPSAYDASSRGNRDNSDFWVRDAKYLRLKNLEIGYTVNGPGLKRAGIQTIRVSLSGTNLFTWTGLKDVDPERGDQLTYPIVRMYNFGLNLQF
jgi:TonB-linked SusC/RagA family outer membrane protein